jgi:hypothetical protein
VRRSVAFLHSLSSGPPHNAAAARTYLDMQWAVAAAARIQTCDDRDSAVYRARAPQIVKDAVAAYLAQRKAQRIAARRSLLSMRF